MLSDSSLEDGGRRGDVKQREREGEGFELLMASELVVETKRERIQLARTLSSSSDVEGMPCSGVVEG